MILDIVFGKERTARVDEFQPIVYRASSARAPEMPCSGRSA